MAFPLPRELNPIEAIKKEMKAIEKKRYVHPQFDPQLNRWLAVFIWDDGSLTPFNPNVESHSQFKKAKPSWKTRVCTMPDDTDVYDGRWLLVGITKKPRRWSVKALRKIRRKLKVPKTATMHVTDLWRGASAVPTQPPVRRTFTTAPTTVSPMSLELIDLGSERRRKIKRSPEHTQAFSTKVRFIAMGMMAHTKRPRPTYLGPLMETKLGAARKEAKQMFKMYKNVWVFDLEKLHSRWRRKIRSGHYRPGTMFDQRMTDEMHEVDAMVAVATLLRQS